MKQLIRVMADWFGIKRGEAMLLLTKDEYQELRREASEAYYGQVREWHVSQES